MIMENTDVKDTQKQTEGEQTPTGENLLTQEQVNEIVSKRLERERAKFEEQLAEKERLAQLSAEEKAEELRKIREKELADKERELTFRELEIDTKHTLVEKGIPESFSQFLIQNDKDATDIAIDSFLEEWSKTINEKVEKEVNERLKGKDQHKEINLPGGKTDNLDMISDIAKQANIRG